ncbi:MAG: hypothetical protein CVV52_07135 [Spirochaetae bacterium HGW-Spirochaetae-8]|nr:MAG: hypothetical protein CVV52_07135 [Spirochaetae bacterium HGW-Spirochaetae-8]
MKKQLLMIAVFLFVVTMTISAEIFPDFFYPNTSFRPISARSEAMGGAGLATAIGNDAFFINPANLADRRFSLNLPSVTLSVFNPKGIVDSTLLDKVQAPGDWADITVAAIDTYLDLVEAGRGEVLTTDVATSYTIGNFGLGLHAQQQLHTTSTDGEPDSDAFIAEINLALSLGLGFCIDLVPDVISLDLGATARLAYKAYTSQISSQQVTSMIGADNNQFEDILTNEQLAAGWALPIDVGANLNLPIGFTVSAVARNLSCEYEMYAYSELGVGLNSILRFIGVAPVYEDLDTEATLTGFSYEVPWTLDLGLGWEPRSGSLARRFKPAIAVDLVDFLGILESGVTTVEDLTSHIQAGVELQLLSLLDIRAGISRNYRSFGVGIDLILVHIDASYYWKDFGDASGEKAVDVLTVRVNIGVDGL